MEVLDVSKASSWQISMLRAGGGEKAWVGAWRRKRRVENKLACSGAVAAGCGVAGSTLSNAQQLRSSMGIDLMF